MAVSKISFLYPTLLNSSTFICAIHKKVGYFVCCKMVAQGDDRVFGGSLS